LEGQRRRSFRQALRAAMRKSRLLKGDVEGHEFHGNQYTGGIDEASAMRFFGGIKEFPEENEKFNADQVAAGRPTLSANEFNALKNYTDNGFWRMNKPLHEGGFRTYKNGVETFKPFSGDKKSENLKQAARLLDSALAKLPTYEGSVERGISLSGKELDNFLSSHGVGDVVTEKSFTYATRFKAEQMDSALFSGGKINIKLEMASKNGVNVSLPHLRDPSEKEVLFRPNTKFKMDSVRVENGVHIFKMREVERGVAKLFKLLTDRAAHQAATSYLNLKPQPTEAQRHAQNYQMGHVNISGLDITIENPAGSHRRPEWPELKSHYGYIRGTAGADGAHVDCFVRVGTPENYGGDVHVVNQVKTDGSFDEHKAIIGHETAEGARQAYLENYERGWQGLGSMVTLPMEDFKAWLRDGDTKRPLQKGDVEGHEFHGNQWTGGGGALATSGQIERDKGLRDYLEMVSKMSEAGPRGSIEEYVLKNGQAFQSSTRKLPESVRAGKLGLCFMNAYQAADTHSNLTYVEGFATVYGAPIAHAWTVDERNRVIDPTWSGKNMLTSGTAYFGVKMPIDKVRETIYARGKYGVLHNPEQGFPLLRGEHQTRLGKGDLPGHEFHGNQWTEGVGNDAKIDELLVHVDQDPRVIAAEKANAARGDARDDPGVRDAQGNYTPAAAAENRAIARSFLDSAALPPAGVSPSAVITIGKPGSGKTTLLESPSLAHLPTAVQINPDAIMEKIPGHSNELGTAYHERAADIAKNDLIPIALAGGYNISIDVSGKNSQKMVTLAENLKGRGYTVSVVYAKTSDLIAAQRVYSRFTNGGRYMPVALAAKDYKVGPQRSYAALKTHVDSWSTYDTNTKANTLLDTGSRAPSGRQLGGRLSRRFEGDSASESSASSLLKSRCIAYACGSRSAQSESLEHLLLSQIRRSA
jgi:predicted ABC-type ATPase